VSGLRIEGVNALVLHQVYRKGKELTNEAMSDRIAPGPL